MIPNLFIKVFKNIWLLSLRFNDLKQIWKQIKDKKV